MYISRCSCYLRQDLTRFGGLCWWLLFRLLPALVLVSLSLLFLSVSVAKAEGDFDTVGSGQLMVRSGSGEYHPMLLQQSEVQVDVIGMLATVTLRQTFENTGSDWLEGVYAFPLPESAAVKQMEMQIGERVIRGSIMERVKAAKVYEKAMQAGKKASLVEQQRPNLFTSRVANIPPGETLSVEIVYVEPVEYRAGKFSLRLPTTITPRYMPGAVEERVGETSLHNTATPVYSLASHGWARPTAAVEDADRISPMQHPLPGSDTQPLNMIRISARLDMGLPLASVESPYHEIALSRRAGIYDVQLASGQAEMDRDFELRWQPLTGNAPEAAFFFERLAGEYYGLLMVMPPAPQRAPEPPPREMVFVVDTSGSMGGEPIRQARESLIQALGYLRPQDSFNIIEFNTHHRALFRRACPATRHYLEQATEFIRHLDASGGTEMLPALRSALSGPVEPDEYRGHNTLRQVVFMTDGAVGNEDALFEEIVNGLGSSRLFTIGIGSAPNSWFMREAASYGRGTFTYIADVQEVGSKLSTLFHQLSSPVATGLTVNWPQTAQVWPRRMPDLYQGEPLVVSVNFGEQMPAGSLTIRGELNGENWQRSIPLPVGVDRESAVDHPGVASLWARKKIAAIQAQAYRGMAKEELRNKILPLALQHQLLSPFTSFVAVEEKISRPRGKQLESHPVANTRPRGQSAQSYAYPVTATTAPANVWFGMLLLLIAILVRAVSGEDNNNG